MRGSSPDFSGRGVLRGICRRKRSKNTAFRQYGIESFPLYSGCASFYQPTFSMPGRDLYMIFPKLEAINRAKEMIGEIRQANDDSESTFLFSRRVYSVSALCKSMTSFSAAS